MISADNVKAGVMLAALGLAAFVGWKVYKTGADASQAVRDLWDAGAQKIEAAGAAVNAATMTGGWADPAQFFMPGEGDAYAGGYTGAVITDAEAAAARSKFATYDPRRLDLYPDPAAVDLEAYRYMR